MNRIEYIKSFLNKLSTKKYLLISNFLLDLVEKELSVKEILENKELTKLFISTIYFIKNKLSKLMIESIDNNNLHNSYKSLLNEWNKEYSTFIYPMLLKSNTEQGNSINKEINIILNTTNDLLSKEIGKLKS